MHNGPETEAESKTLLMWSVCRNMLLQPIFLVAHGTLSGLTQHLIVSHLYTRITVMDTHKLEVLRTATAAIPARKNPACTRSGPCETIEAQRHAHVQPV